MQACGVAYHSFRASDCTYQPMSGARRACPLTDGLVLPIIEPLPKEQRVARQPIGSRNPRETEWVGTRQPPDAQLPAQPWNDKGPMSETERIVRNMTPDDEENIVVQDGQGRLFILRKSYR
jgi:hypothetical protein